MKKGILLLAFFSLLFSAYSQTLFTYGNHPVTTSEFLRAYNKNKTASPDERKALKEYLDLYTLFKLKVQAAKDLHLDTLPAQQADLQNFRSQIEENYLKDDKKVDALMDEAFARSQKDIHVLDLFVKVPENTDTAIYFKTIKEVDHALKINKKSIKETLEKVNQNGVNVVENDLGFITVFTLPYEFENIVYGLRPGQSSAPYRTKKGWHVFKNEEERHGVGKIKIAQILLTAPAGSIDEIAKTKKLADSIYNVLQHAADFGAMAKEFSNDRATYFNGGEMPEFGVAKYNPVFEKVAFSLTKDNEISQPFETDFGFHILKRLTATPVPSSKNDEVFMYYLKQEILKDSRIESAKQQFVKKIIPKIGYKKMAVNQPDLWRISDSSLMANKNITSGSVNEKTILFSYNDHSQVKVNDWISFLRNSGKVVPGQMHQSYTTLWPEFISFSAVENYRKRLQNFSPEFKDQVQEFKDGNMLFEVMERKVWGKAAADSAGLLQFYNQHRQKYVWNASAGVIIFSCSNENVAKESSDELQKGKLWKEVMNGHSSQVQADSGRYELAQIPVIEGTHFAEGLITQPVINKNDGTVVFTKVIKLYPANQQRSFEEARGLVINDYQHFIEEKWMEQLKKQYPIKVNEKVFRALLK